MPKRNARGNAAHQREDRKQGIISPEEAKALSEDPTYTDTEAVDSFDADSDVKARAAVLNLSRNTLKYISIAKETRAPERWRILTPSDNQLHVPNTIEDAPKTVLPVIPAVSSTKTNTDPDLLPDWESQEVNEQFNCYQSKQNLTESPDQT